LFLPPPPPLPPPGDAPFRSGFVAALAWGFGFVAAAFAVAFTFTFTFAAARARALSRAAVLVAAPLLRDAFAFACEEAPRRERASVAARTAALRALPRVLCGDFVSVDTFARSAGA
jgi:hypothetical protein